MLTRIAYLFIGLVLVIAWRAGRADAQMISGRVTDSAGGSVAGVELRVTPGGASARTDDSGFFAIGPLRPGSYAIALRRIGYVPATRVFRAPARGLLLITLARIPVQLDTIRTNALRQQLPRVFLRHDEHLGALLYGPALADLFQRADGRTIADALRFNRAFALKLMPRLGCNPTEAFVDGIRVRSRIEDYIRPPEIAAIEVFDSPDFVHEPFIDGQAAGAGSCQRIVLIWSKRYRPPRWAGH